LREYGGAEKLKVEDDVPEPPISGDTVLIAATAASVNPIDWKIRSGARQKDFPLSFPAILGRDVSGIVRAVGANVKHFKPGERVLALSKCHLGITGNDTTIKPHSRKSASFLRSTEARTERGVHCVTQILFGQRDAQER
jgi:NADPH:quinone reductase-like Zn-dependent oxidoreductase